MVWQPCMWKSHIVWANHIGFPFPTTFWGEVLWGRLKKEAHLNQRFGCLDFHSILQGKKKFLPHKQNNHYLLSGKVSTEQGSSKSTSLLPKPTADQASLVTTWLSVSLLKLLAMATGDVWTKPMQRPVKNVALFPYQCNCLCWKIAMGRLHWILLCWMWQVPLAWPWESDSHGAPSCVGWDFVCPMKTMWSVGDFVLQCWGEIMYCHCDGNCAGSSISDQNWIKKREAAASRLRQVDSHCRGLTVKSTCEWMNESLLLCSLPVYPFLILSYQVVCFWEQILQHDLACCLSIPCYLSSFKVLGWFLPVTPFSRNRHLKEKLRPNFHMFCTSSWNLFRISLPINAKKNLLQHLFFAKHAYLLELHLELNSGSSLHLYRSLSLF